MNIFRKSILSGLINFIPAILMLLISSTDQLHLFNMGNIFLLGYLFLPGLIYSLVLIEHVKSPNRLKSLFFIIIATGTYLYAFLLCSEFLTKDKNLEWIIFPISILSFQVLLVLYYFFLDRVINIKIAFFLGTLLSAACALVPFWGVELIRNDNSLGIVLCFSIIFTWQTAFGWLLNYSKQMYDSDKNLNK